MNSHVSGTAPAPASTVALGAGGQATLSERHLAWARLAEAASLADAAPVWLDLLCTGLPRACGGVLVAGEPDVGPFTPLALWPAGGAPSALLAQASQGALEARAPSMVEDGGRCAVALPFVVAGRLHGLAAVEMAASSGAAQALEALRWACGHLETCVRAEAARAQDAALARVTTALNLLAGTLAEQNFAAAAHALATDLALQLNCDRVSIGFVRKGSAMVEAVSHSAQFGERMNLIRAIGLAMDEALDQNSSIVFPPGVPDAPAAVLVTRDHAALARQHGCGAILSVPFVIAAGSDAADAAADGHEPVRGAFCFERAAHQPFDAGTVELCQGAVALAARVLATQRRSERNWAERLSEHLRAHYVQMLGPRHFGRKLTALLVVSAAIFFMMTQGRYDVSANATLEGAVRRVVVAPYDGYIEAAPHRAGDRVKAGDVLAAMDQRDLQLEQMRAAGMVEQYTKQAQGAMAEHDRAQGAISEAQAQQAQAQLDLLADQLQRAEIKAPFDGIVVSGDLSQQLGGAVKRGQVLFEVSPLNAYRVTLEVDESEIDAVQFGQRGRLVLVALPGREWPLTVTRITPVTVAHEGRSFFRVEASLAQGLAGTELRPGMEGVGKIEVGRRHLFWIWTHRFFDWLRVWAWSWL